MRRYGLRDDQWERALVHENHSDCVVPQLPALFDANGDRHAEAGHCVEHVAGALVHGYRVR